MINQKYRNPEGISLLTGVPNQRSLRLWLNYQHQPKTGGKHTSVTNDSYFNDPVQTQNNEEIGSLEHRIEDEHLCTGLSEDLDAKPAGKIIISTFDSAISTRRQLDVKSNQIKEIASSAHGEVYAQLENGVLGLLSKPPSHYDHDNSGLMFNEKLANRTKSSVYSQKDFLRTIVLEADMGFVANSPEKWFWSIPQFPALIPIDRVTCGKEHTCVVTDSCSGRRLYAWGSNSQGQCGLPIEKHNKIVHHPTPVKGIDGPVVEIGCGQDYTCCVASASVGLSLYSFGGSPSHNKFSSLFRAATSNDSSVPHVDGNSNVLQPLITFQPGSESANKSRPYSFWTPSLSEWIVNVDKEWEANASYPLIRLDAQEGDDDDFESAVELENARSRLQRMRASLDADVSRCSLFPADEMFEDPAPYEIQKMLTIINFELEQNKDQRELLKDDAGFEEDVYLLEQDHQKICETKEVYEKLKQIWDSKSVTPASKEYDREVLYSLLEDCRRSELSPLVREEYHRIEALGGPGARANSLPSLTTIISQSRRILETVKRGLDDFKCSPKLEVLHASVVALHSSKIRQLESIENYLSETTLKICDTLLQGRDQLLAPEDENKFDLSHLSIK